jgi:RNA polymerase sigma-70 factor (ECF subfamily)
LNYIELIHRIKNGEISPSLWGDLKNELNHNKDARACLVNLILSEKDSRTAHEFFTVFFLMYSPDLYKILRWKLLLENDFNLEDLVQETLFRAYRFIDTYKPEYPFQKWIVTIGMNLWRNQKKKLANRITASDIDDMSYKEQHWQQLKRVWMDEEICEGLVFKQAFSRLPELDRKVLEFHYCNGLTYKEIGELFSMTEPAVKSRLFRARQRLKEFLEEGKG